MIRISTADGHGKPQFDGFAQIGLQLIEGFSLGEATRQGRHFGPPTAFFRLVNDGFQSHETVMPRIQPTLKRVSAMSRREGRVRESGNRMLEISEQPGIALNQGG